LESCITVWPADSCFYGIGDTGGLQKNESKGEEHSEI
jgi:hypothetical protein